MMDWLHWLFYVGVILGAVPVMVMAFIWLERRGLGRLQLRPGPNRAGPFGILQPVADAIKVLTKEDIVPVAGDHWVHFVAPLVVFAPAMLVFTVIPFQEDGGLVRGLVPDLNIGILYIVAVSSISTIGVFMAAWGSNNKYSLISAFRSMAQVVSYEIPLALAILGVVLAAGTMSLTGIVQAQAVPFIVMQPLGFIIFFIAATAELNRTPFDLMEAESEMVAGYHIEYSGMKFALFYLAEYAYTVGISAIAATLFLGGWKAPWGVGPQVGVLWLVVKILLVFMVILWIRGTFPRVRVDQLMGFAWKFLFPLSLINIFIIAAESLAWPGLPWWLLFPNTAIALVLVVVWSGLFRLGGGRVQV
ncbi:MAG: NADH-quinone oxidoreductase subunit NuoH [Dehalococcoidia bacterium]|nr:NADH-quinone oxidoreductase subunit NuoH [Dehalococcoidia bacterium]MDP7469411.1 NADH-quinone oxidoreductase subunit NuoH [Dehalococcoidia bacterium]